MQLSKDSRYPWRAFLDENRTHCGACVEEFTLWTSPQFEYGDSDYLICLPCCNTWRESKGYSKLSVVAEDEKPVTDEETDGR